jgi:hypothetical protein
MDFDRVAAARASENTLFVGRPVIMFDIDDISANPAFSLAPELLLSENVFPSLSVEIIMAFPAGPAALPAFAAVPVMLFVARFPALCAFAAVPFVKQARHGVPSRS